MKTAQKYIVLKSGGQAFEYADIQDCAPGERDKSGILTTEGGVNFTSPKGKRWFLRFSEFSFLIPSGHVVTEN